LTGWLAIVSVAAHAAMAENPYAPIVERNMFALVPIPTNNPADAAALAFQPPKITPNGIMTLFGKLQVLFKVAVAAKPGQPAKDESYVMGVGERQDEIEVQKIDEPSATITFNNHGMVQELPLVAAGGGGGAAAPAGSSVPQPAVNPGGGMPAAPGAMPANGLGTRSGRTRPGGNSSNQNSSGTPNYGANTGADISGSSANASTANLPGGMDPAVVSMSPEARILMMEAQRAKWIQQGNPAAGIIPSTPITSQVTGEGDSSGAGSPPGP